jgi:DNA topoisomerase-1
VSDANKLLKVFEEDAEIKVLQGRWGPYIGKGKENYRLPKGQKVEDLTYEVVAGIIEAEEKNKPASKKVAAKKAPVKKIAAKRKVVVTPEEPKKLAFKKGVVKKPIAKKK